jgi:hypothetical protein
MPKGFSARNGDLGLYFLKAKRIHRQKMGKYKWRYHTLGSARMKFRNKKKFRYGIPSYTGPFQELITANMLAVYVKLFSLVSNRMVYEVMENRSLNTISERGKLAKLNNLSLSTSTASREVSLIQSVYVVYLFNGAVGSADYRPKASKCKTIGE